MTSARVSTRAIHLFALLLFLFGVADVQLIHQCFHHHRPLLADTDCRSAHSHQNSAAIEKHQSCPICEILASFQIMADGFPDRDRLFPPPIHGVAAFQLSLLQTNFPHIFEARAPPVVRP